MIPLLARVSQGAGGGSGADYLQALLTLGADHVWMFDDAEAPITDYAGSLTETPGLFTYGQNSPFADKTSVYLGSGASRLLAVDTTAVPASLASMGASGGAFSVGGWIKTAVVGGGANNWFGNNTIFELRRQTSSDRLVPFSIANVGGQVSFGYSSALNDNSRVVATGLPSLSADVWRFVCVVRDGSSAVIQVDDTEWSTTLPHGDVDEALSTLTANLSFGCRTKDDGDLDDFHTNFNASGWFIFADTALTKTERDALFEYGG